MGEQKLSVCSDCSHCVNKEVMDWPLGMRFGPPPGYYDGYYCEHELSRDPVRGTHRKCSSVNNNGGCKLFVLEPNGCRVERVPDAVVRRSRNNWIIAIAIVLGIATVYTLVMLLSLGYAGGFFNGS